MATIDLRDVCDLMAKVYRGKLGAYEEFQDESENLGARIDRGRTSKSHREESDGILKLVN